MLPMHQNLLAVYPKILERLATVEGVKAVKEVGEMAELVAAAREKRRVCPVDGAVYVVFGGMVPDESAARARVQSYRLHFTFALAKTYSIGAKSRLAEVGRVLTAIAQAFNGWDSPGDIAEPLRQEPAPPIEYNDGYALYPLSYSTRVIIAA